MKTTFLSWLGAPLLFLAGNVSGQSFPDGIAVAVELESGQRALNVLYDVPENTNSIHFMLQNGTGDFDLFVRQGSPWPESQLTSAQGLFDGASYVSLGADSEETIDVAAYAPVPPDLGPWYISIVNFGPTTETVELRIDASSSASRGQIIVDFQDTSEQCDTAPFSDPAPIAPVGGNPGTTLGEARRNAALEAARILNENLITAADITVQFCWDSLEFGDNGAVLAQAGPRGAFLGLPHFPLQDAFVSWPLFWRWEGTDPCRYFSDIDCGLSSATIVFNVEVDLQGNGWYYGYDIRGSAATDFISTAMHEITHGLGFLSFVNVETGQLAQDHDATASYSDIFLSKMAYFNNDQLLPMPDLDDSTRLDAITSEQQLVWTGALATDDNNNVFDDFESGHPLMNAPMIVEPGSSLSHLSTTSYENGGLPIRYSTRELMRPNLTNATRNMGIAREMLQDAGWDESVKAAIADKMPAFGLWGDRGRNGTGIDLRVVDTAAGSTAKSSNLIYFLTFFSYANDNRQEWFISTGSLTGNYFSSNDVNRVFYDFDLGNIDASLSANVGSINIEFNASASHSVCSDGVDRSDAVELAILHWAIDTGETGSWCIEPLLNAPVEGVNFGGHWFAGDGDSGWGFTLEIEGANAVVTLYYYDAGGNPRWTQGVTPFDATHMEFSMQDFVGFCRLCAPTDVISTAMTAGTLILDLGAPSQATDGGNSVTMDVTFQGTEGGTWSRTNTTIQLISTPE